LTLTSLLAFVLHHHQTEHSITLYGDFKKTYGLSFESTFEDKFR